jgi:L-ectoine synthase
MIVKTLEDVTGTKGEAHGDKWHSMRLLHAEDGMGVTLTDSILEEGFRMTLWQKNHLEACYCLEGEGVICTFVPALTGTETHDEDGSLSRAKGKSEPFSRGTPA